MSVMTLLTLSSILTISRVYLSNDRYTLEMVRIDDKVKRVITDIKLEEAAIAHRQNTVEGSAPQVSVAT